MKNFKKIAFITSLAISTSAHSILCVSLTDKGESSVHHYAVENDPVKLEVRSAFKFAGMIKLVNLGQDAVTKAARAVYESSIKKLLVNEHPEVRYQSDDALLALDVRGERNGTIRTLAQRAISQYTLNIVGLDAVIINYRPTEESKGNSRLVFVIKKNVKDYRDPDTAPEGIIKDQEDAQVWLANKLDDLYTKFFSEANLDINLKFDQIYNSLAKRPGVPEDSPRAYISKSEFASVYTKALDIFMSKLSGDEVLHIRPSFWDKKPVADEFAVTMFTLLKQNSSTVAFTDGFEENASSLRNRLYNQIHRLDSGGGHAGFGNGGASGRSVEAGLASGVRSRGDGAEVHSLSGASAQATFATDFFTGFDHQNVQLSEIQNQMSPTARNAAQRIQQYGVTELSNLNGRNALELMNQTNISVVELTALAVTLADHGVYFRYPPQVYFKIPQDVRVVIKHPSGNSFGYSTRSNTYRPR